MMLDLNRAFMRFALASAALGMLALVFYYGQANAVSRLGEQAMAAAESRVQALKTCSPRSVRWRRSCRTIAW